MYNVKIIFLALAMMVAAIASAQQTAIAPDTCVILFKEKPQQVLDSRIVFSTYEAMRQYLLYGAVLERKVGENKYEEVSRVKPKSVEQLNATLRTANLADRDAIEFAKELVEGAPEQNAPNLQNEHVIDSLVKYEEDKNFVHVMSILQGIRSPLFFELLGIAFEMPKPSQPETYRVRILIPKSDNYQVVGKPISTTQVIDQINEHAIKTIVGDGELSFSWQRPDDDLGLYEAERALTGSNAFTLITDPPVTVEPTTNTAGIEDSTVINYVSYTYRFYSYDLFGDRNLIGEETAMARDLTPPPSPIMLLPEHSKPDEAEITWDMSSGSLADLKGFAILRSSSKDSGYSVLLEQLLPPATRSFKDSRFNREGSNYYLIHAIDTAGNFSSSMPGYLTVRDSTPPAQPKLLTGKMDTNGVVTITIERGKEKDLMGYRLFRANADYHEFSVIQEHFSKLDSNGRKPIQTVFYDTVTLNSLTPYVYYKAQALDLNYNKSPLSEPLKVKRIDTIPPSQPIFHDVDVRKEGIQLTFAVDEGEDITRHEFYRRESPTAEWQVLKTFSVADSVYLDKSVETATFYYYSIRSVDDSDLYSEYARPVHVKSHTSSVCPPVSNLKITQPEENEFKLTWDYNTKVTDPIFVIYRTNASGQLVQFKSTDKREFVAQLPPSPEGYAVRVMLRNGQKSDISKPVKTPNNDGK